MYGIKMSEINANFLACSINFINASILDIRPCIKVYTFCQYGAFFTKCTIMDVEIVRLFAPLNVLNDISN